MSAVAWDSSAYRRARLTLLFVLLVSGGVSCSRLARCEMDKVRAEVLDYDQQRRALRASERQLNRSAQHTFSLLVGERKSAAISLSSR